MCGLTLAWFVTGGRTRLFAPGKVHLDTSRAMLDNEWQGTPILQKLSDSKNDNDRSSFGKRL